MHHGDRALAAGVWVGVAVGRRAVGGPAGVAHPGGAGQRMRGDLLVQVGQLAGATLDGQAAVEDGHPGAVVAAILQSAQAVHDDTQRLLIPDVPNDSTHVLSVTGPVGASARNRRTGPVTLSTCVESLGTSGIKRRWVSSWTACADWSIAATTAPGWPSSTAA